MKCNQNVGNRFSGRLKSTGFTIFLPFKNIYILRDTKNLYIDQCVVYCLDRKRLDYFGWMKTLYYVTNSLSEQIESLSYFNFLALE